MNEIDTYLGAVPDPELRALLERLRALIAAVAPESVEGWSYGMPAFRYRDKPLAGFNASRQHAGFYPMSGDLIERHAAELVGYSTSKGTLRLTQETGIPEALITAMVRERMAEIEAQARR